MTIPGDFPLGTYVVEGYVWDTSSNPTLVTLKLIVVDAGPTLNITGATATPSGLPAVDMPGSVPGGYTLLTDGNSGTDYLIDFAAGSVSSEPLADDFFGLYLINTTVDLPTLLAYYATKPDPYKDYLNQAAVGGEPFVYIRGGAGNTISLIDAAKHDIALTDVAMTVPGDYPEGTYTVQGEIEDVGGNPSTVTLKLIVKHMKVISVDPATGPTYGGDLPVSIIGSGFTGATEVNFGCCILDPGTDFVVYNDTRIDLISLPSHVAGLVHVSVTTPAGTATKNDVFEYVEPVATTATNGQWREAGSGDPGWTSNTGVGLPNGTFIDLRLRILDQWGNKLVTRDASVLHPWYRWEFPADPSDAALNDGRAPVSPTTDADGWVYWQNEGGQSDRLFDLWVGLDEDGNESVDPGEYWDGPFTITWSTPAP